MIPVTPLAKNNFVYAIFATIISIASSSMPAHSAEFKSIQSDRCFTQLSGSIVTGDAQRFLNYVTRVSRLKLLNSRICLNSNGGSYREGINLARLFNEHTLVTVVDRGDTCLSACAIAFMGGTTRDDGGVSRSRRLHILGKLGFHAPYLKYSSKFVPSTIANEAYHQAVVHIGELAQMSDLLDFERSLLAEMLMKGPNEILYVDTIEKAGRWGISIFGYEDGIKISPNQITKELALQACKNAYLWHNRYDSVYDNECSECTSPDVPNSYEISYEQGDFGTSTRMNIDAYSMESGVGFCKLKVDFDSSLNANKVYFSDYIQSARFVTMHENNLGPFVFFPGQVRLALLASKESAMACITSKSPTNCLGAPVSVRATQRLETDTNAQNVLAFKEAQDFYYLHLSSARSQRRLELELTQLTRLDSNTLQNMEPFFQEVNLGGRGIWHRLMLGPAMSLDTARKLCTRISKRTSSYCAPLRP